MNGKIITSNLLLIKWPFLVCGTVGSEFLGKKFVEAKIRERIFQCTVGIILMTTINMLLVTILVLRNEYYSTYRVFQQLDDSCLTSILRFLIFVGVELFLIINLTINSLLTTTALYATCFSMKFWLQKIW